MKAASTKQKAHLDSPDSITATASGEISPAECPPPATTHLNTARGSLLVRVLNRNLAQQQQESSLQSLSSDPLLNALPAGEATCHVGLPWLVLWHVQSLQGNYAIFQQI